jgi:hypothetical protein
MIFWLIMLGYILVGTVMAKLVYNENFDKAVERQLDLIKSSYSRVPYEIRKGSKETKLQYAISEVKKDPPVVSAGMVFLFWPAALTFGLLILVCMGIQKMLGSFLKPSSVKKLETMNSETEKKAKLDKAYAVLKEAGIDLPKEVQS